MCSSIVFEDVAVKVHSDYLACHFCRLQNHNTIETNMQHACFLCAFDSRFDRNLRTISVRVLRVDMARNLHICTHIANRAGGLYSRIANSYLFA